MSVGELLEREAERPAYVRFEVRAIPDAEATLAAGHHVSKDENWVLVTPPYSKDCVESPAEKWFAQKEIDVRNGRVPQRHMDMWKDAYKRWLAGLDEPINGTSVKEWNAISPAQCKNLLAVNIRTIEDVAAANDEGLRRMGMGGVDLRNKARVWLQAAKDHGPLINEVTSLKKENDVLKGSVESLTEQVALLKRHLESKGEPMTPKVIEETNDTISAADIIEPTLAEQYEQKFGKKPHHLMKDETIRARLAE
jgi:hypothetical protein